MLKTEPGTKVQVQRNEVLIPLQKQMRIQKARLGRGARAGWGKGFKAPKLPSRDAKGVEGWGIRKQTSVLSKRHRMPVAQMYVVN